MVKMLISLHSSKGEQFLAVNLTSYPILDSIGKLASVSTSTALSITLWIFRVSLALR